MEGIVSGGVGQNPGAHAVEQWWGAEVWSARRSLDSPQLWADRGPACPGRSGLSVAGGLLWLLLSHCWFMLRAQAEAR